MRIKEFILWYNGIQQYPKTYRSYNINNGLRVGNLSDILKYVVTGERCGMNTKKFNNDIFYFGLRNGKRFEINMRKHIKGTQKTKKNNKIWRQDLNLWETSTQYWFIKYYKYSVRIGGTLKTTTSLIRK